jgi:hypothetical protein
VLDHLRRREGVAAAAGIGRSGGQGLGRSRSGECERCEGKGDSKAVRAHVWIIAGKMKDLIAIPPHAGR